MKAKRRQSKRKPRVICNLGFTDPVATCARFPVPRLRNAVNSLNGIATRGGANPSRTNIKIPAMCSLPLTLIQDECWHYELDGDRLPALEGNVMSQAQGSSPYNFDNNMAVLKLYSLLPSRSKDGVISQVLLLALSRLPEGHFAQCLFLVPQDPKGTLANILAIGHALENCNFSLFWAEVKKAPEAAAIVPSFIDAAREFLVSLIAKTFRSIAKQDLLQMLNLEASQLGPLVAKQGWSSGGEMILLPENVHNHPSPVDTRQPIKFSQVRAALGSLESV